jgi:hypothetical protein
MLNNVLQRPETIDAGSIILTRSVPEIVLSSVCTVIEEYKNINRTQGTRIEQINTE